eukprot:CAMPEP_0185758446 /NCGR_PEP_ID=MMETSP1174-20130828/17105_1 /TAXON_ID=35687 /ORGANISM="Dictyocha speculum, Strain CCMP1381" /LENGTH=71 /DNA_ID=CAMNT_0028438307 /DNA_START=41 /DNA_END=256 /DNA_ORIENTATION=-
MKSSDVKGLLKANTEEAVHAGVYGSPTLEVHADHLNRPIIIFGSDRFEQLGFLLGKRWEGPDPTNHRTARL